MHTAIVVLSVLDRRCQDALDCAQLTEEDPYALEREVFMAMESTIAPDDQLGGMITIADVCEYLSISRPTVYRLIESGKIRAVKICGQRRVPRVDVLNLVSDELAGC